MLFPSKRRLLSGQKSPVGTQLKPQFFTQRLTLLEAREELVEEADNYGIYTDALSLSPVFELGADLCADLKELRKGLKHQGNETDFDQAKPMDAYFENLLPLTPLENQLSSASNYKTPRPIRYR